MNKGQQTRQTILIKAFKLIYLRGYQNTSIDDILETTQVTKGSFYYHFKNKDEMGLAIINELLKPTMAESFIAPLAKAKNPAVAIHALIKGLLLKNKFLKPEYGCPASNLTQEMAPWNKKFSRALSDLTSQWQEAMTAVIERGKEEGLVRSEVNGSQVTGFIVAGYWGIRNLARLDNSKKVYEDYLKELKSYLKSLEYRFYLKKHTR